MYIVLMYQYKVVSEELDKKSKECLSLSNELSDLRKKYNDIVEKVLSLEEGLKVYIILYIDYISKSKC